jgi:hypothetical protein
MKIEISLCLSLVALAGLLGCATRVPKVEYHNYSQKKVQAMKHWDQMAQEVLDKINANTNFAGRSIAVNQPANASAFLVFFNQMVTTGLLKTGGPAKYAEAPAAPLTLDVQTQLVRHSRRFGWYPGGGILSGDFLNSLLWGGNPASVLSGFINAPFNLVTGRVFGTPRETASELLVMSVIAQDGVPQMAIKQIVYVDRDEDVALYWRPARFVGTYEPPSPIKVTTEP